MGILKKNIGTKTNKIKILAKGVLLDDIKTSDKKNLPFFDLMSYVHTKYHKYYENIDESALSEQISYWFYTSLLFKSVSDTKSSLGTLTRILKLDREISRWYMEFYRESETHYENRLLSIHSITL